MEGIPGAGQVKSVYWTYHEDSSQLLLSKRSEGLRFEN